MREPGEPGAKGISYPQAIKRRKAEVPETASDPAVGHPGGRRSRSGAGTIREMADPAQAGIRETHRRTVGDEETNTGNQPPAVAAEPPRPAPAERRVFYSCGKAGSSPKATNSEGSILWLPFGPLGEISDLASRKLRNRDHEIGYRQVYVDRREDDHGNGGTRRYVDT